MNKLLITLGSLAVIAAIQSCKMKNADSVVTGDAAAKVYVAPGKYDEFYNFVSGGFSGNVTV